METEIRTYLSNKRRKLNPEVAVVVAESTQDGIKFTVSGQGKAIRIQCSVQQTDNVVSTRDGEEDDEHDNSFDLELGAAVSQITILETLSHSQDRHDRFVLAVACADLTLRLLSCPVHMDMSKRQNEVSMTTIDENIAHRDYITSLAMTSEIHEADVSTRNPSTSRSRTRSNDKHKKNTLEQDIVIYIASASQTGTGLLTIHSIHLQDHLESGEDANCELLTRHTTKCPVIGSTLGFKSRAPNTIRSPLTLLLTSPSAGFVRLFELPLDQRSNTNSQTQSATDTTLDLLPLRPLITLKADFVSSEVSQIPRRKHIVDATWLSQGRAVLAVLEDETYGVWDVEGICSTATQNLIRGQNAVSGLTGGSTSKFAMKGSIKSLLSQPSAKFEIRDKPVASAIGVFSKPLATNKEQTAIFTDQKVDYDIGGLDQMLDSMDSNTLTTNATKAAHLVDDMDVDMMSPSVQRSAKSRLTVTKTGAQTRQKLFG